MRACREAGVPFDLEAQLRTLQGELLWVRCVGQPLRDQEGHRGHRRTGAGDRSRRLPAGHAAAPHGEHGRCRGQREAFVTVDPQGRISHANQQAGQVLAPREALPGRKIWSFFQKRARLALEERFLQALERREGIELEEMNAQGSRWLELRGFPFGAGLALHLRGRVRRRRASST